MRPIIFCDFAFASNIEEFIIENLQYIKNKGYTTFVVDSSEQNLDAHVAIKDLQISELLKSKQGESNLVKALIINIKANLKMLQLADKQGIKIIYSAANVVNEVNNIKEIHYQNKKVFAYLANDHCVMIENQYPSLNSRFFHSRKDTQEYYKLQGNVHPRKIPTSSNSIEDETFIDILEEDNTNNTMLNTYYINDPNINSTKFFDIYADEL